MSIKQMQINVEDLALGMYVSSLDRPWSRTPFPLQGFLIRSAQDIESLKSYCEFVCIDVAKGRGPLLKDEKIIGKITPGKASSGGTLSQVIALAPLDIDRDIYRTTTSVRQEMVNAQRISSLLKSNLIFFSRQLAAGGPVQFNSLKLSVDAMIDSVLRCPDAFTWLMRLSKEDRSTYDHSMRSALWAVQFARYIGMPKEDISTLCTATLLKDIGKLRISDDLLNVKNRNAEQEAEYRKFVNYGVEMLLNTKEVDKKVISVVRHHCERIDGSGFPEGLVGKRISLLAQVCGVATEYDGISNPRESSKPLTPSRAISELYRRRNISFHEELVVEFIQSVGLYPTGTIVELTTGDVGVVFEQSVDSRLQPFVALIPRKKASKRVSKDQSAVIIDLKDELTARKVLLENGSVKASSVSRLAIARDLESTAYDVNFEVISRALIVTETIEKKGFLSGLKDKFLNRSA